VLYIVRDIENFGRPNNVEMAPNENNLIGFTKKTGRRAHKKKEVFISQVSKHFRELIIKSIMFWKEIKNIWMLKFVTLKK